MTQAAVAALNGKYVPFPELNSDPETALRAAIAAIATAFPDWVPDTSQLDYAMLEQMAAMNSRLARPTG